MSHIYPSNRFSNDDYISEVLSRMRPLSTLKYLIDSVDKHNYTSLFAIVLTDAEGAFTEDDVHFIKMDPETAHYTPISAVRLDNSLKGFLLFAVSQEEAKDLKAAELMTGCLKSALIHLVNGLEELE